MSHKDKNIGNRKDRLRDMQDRTGKCNTHLLKLQKKMENGRTTMLKNMNTFCRN